MANKAAQVRDELNLTQKEAGELLAGLKGKNASDAWCRWERTGKWHGTTDALFKIILSLKMAEDLKTPDVSKGLNVALNALSDDDSHITPTNKLTYRRRR